MSTYAFSDLHAQYDLWKQIQKYIKSEDTIYCLGDCVDRGDVGLEVLNEVMNTSNIIMLRGNHEDFINNIGSEVIHYNSEDDLYWAVSNFALWQANGANKTIKAFTNLAKAKQWQLINKIRKLPTHAEYINTKGEKIYLCHAGRQPNTKEILDMKYGDIPMNNYIWDRYHINDKEWHGKDNEYCVHGHTPVCYINYYHYTEDKDEMPESNFKIFKYCGGHKIDIDLGSFETHTVCLLNLDTWEPIYFKDRTLNKKEWNKVEEKYGRKDF